MSNSALDLEPKSGDYVKYIDQIQAGKVKELSGIRAGVVTQNDIGQVQVKSGRQVIQEEEQIAQERIQQKLEHTRFALNLIGPAILLCGILCFAFGVTYEMEDIIPVGMVLMFIGFVASAKLRDKTRRSR